jgi:hypothetical protein
LFLLLYSHLITYLDLIIILYDREYREQNNIDIINIIILLLNYLLEISDRAKFLRGWPQTRFKDVIRILIIILQGLRRDIIKILKNN